jgi:hypothetical protein
VKSKVSTQVPDPSQTAPFMLHEPSRRTPRAASAGISGTTRNSPMPPIGPQVRTGHRPCSSVFVGPTPANPEDRRSRSRLNINPGYDF